MSILNKLKEVQASTNILDYIEINLENVDTTPATMLDSGGYELIHFTLPKSEFWREKLLQGMD